MRNLLIVILLVCYLNINAQINITPYLPEELYNKFPDAAKIFESKLNNIISSNGIKSQMVDSKFILTGYWVPETKDIVGSAPPQISYTLNINLYIGDGEEGTMYMSETFRVKGVGATEEKACLSAIRNLKGTSPKISEFIKRGKEHIITYYETNKQNILSAVKNSIVRQNDHEALYQLCLIPMECSYYAETLSLIDSVYQRIVDKQAEQIYTKAKVIWASDQSVNGARQLIELISQIDPNATCYLDIQNFILKVTEKVNLENERAYEDYQKRIAHRREMDKLELETAERLHSQRISAARDIASSYIQNNPRTLIYNVGYWY